MTRNEAIALIGQTLGFRTDLDNEIITALKAAQIELEGEDDLPWFLQTSGEITNGVSDFDQIDLPAGWLGELEEESGLWLLDASGGDRSRRLQRDDLSVIWSYPLPLATNADPSVGTPEYYAISDSVIFLGPLKPEEQLYFQYRYLAKAVVLDSNVTNVWLTHAPAVLYNYAGNLIAQDLRDKDASSIFQTRYERSKEKMLQAHRRRLYSGTSPKMRFVHGT